MTSPTSDTAKDLIFESLVALKQHGSVPTEYGYLITDLWLIFPDLRIYRDESFRIFLSGDQWILVHEHDEHGYRNPETASREGREAIYKEALRRLRNNTVLLNLANCSSDGD